MEHSYSLIVDDEYNGHDQGSIPSDLMDSHIQMMKLAVHDAGRWSYGVKAVEVWQYTSKGRLVLAEGGSWVDPTYFQNDDPRIKRALEILYDTSSPDFIDVRKSSFAPGESLSGALWLECYGKEVHQLRNRLTNMNMNDKTLHKKVKWRNVWRNIQGIARDPDQPYCNRTEIVCDAGFYYAAGISFNVRGTKGVVVFMTRKSVDMDKLQSMLNEEYMMSATNHIASVLSLRFPRQCSVLQRRYEARRTFQKARRLVKYVRMFVTSEQKQNGNTRLENSSSSDLNNDYTCADRLKTTCEDCFDASVLFAKSWLLKMRGANVMMPPGMSFEYAMFSWVTAFLSYFIMASLSTSFKMRFGNDLGFELTQLGSMISSIFMLSAAPSSQPSTILLGQSISLTVGLIFSQIPYSQKQDSWTGDEYDSPLGWFRAAIGVSIATGLMAYTGAMHPPSGALVITILDYKSNNPRSYYKVGVLLIQDLLLVFLGAVLNNLNSAKAYPTYWGHAANWLSSKIRKMFGRKEFLYFQNSVPVQSDLRRQPEAFLHHHEDFVSSLASSREATDLSSLASSYFEREEIKAHYIVK